MIRIVLVEPHYPANIGSVARLMKNFGVRDLYIVNPKTDPFSSESRKYAMHGLDILLSARVAASLDEAIEGSSLVVATTGNTTEKSSLRTPSYLHEVSEFLSKYYSSPDTISLVFGREPSGLTNEEISKADITLTILTHHEYTSLNLSHAVGIVLYELFVKWKEKETLYSYTPTNVSFLHVKKLLKEAVYKSSMREKEDVYRMMNAILVRGVRTERELKAFIGVLSKLIGGTNKTGPEKE